MYRVALKAVVYHTLLLEMPLKSGSWEMGQPGCVAFSPHHLLDGCAMLAPSPLRTVATEVGGVLIWAMVVGDGFGLAGFGQSGGQSDHFR
jgi:hypothetical protein